VRAAARAWIAAAAAAFLVVTHRPTLADSSWLDSTLAGLDLVTDISSLQWRTTVPCAIPADSGGWLRAGYGYTYRPGTSAQGDPLDRSMARLPPGGLYAATQYDGCRVAWGGLLNGLILDNQSRASVTSTEFEVALGAWMLPRGLALRGISLNARTRQYSYEDTLWVANAGPVRGEGSSVWDNQTYELGLTCALGRPERDLVWYAGLGAKWSRGRQSCDLYRRYSWLVADSSAPAWPGGSVVFTLDAPRRYEYRAEANRGVLRIGMAALPNGRSMLRAELGVSYSSAPTHETVDTAVVADTGGGYEQTTAWFHSASGGFSDTADASFRVVGQLRLRNAGPLVPVVGIDGQVTASAVRNDSDPAFWDSPMSLWHRNSRSFARLAAPLLVAWSRGKVLLFVQWRPSLLWEHWAGPAGEDGRGEEYTALRGYLSSYSAGVVLHPHDRVRITCVPSLAGSSFAAQLEVRYAW